MYHSNVNFNCKLISKHKIFICLLLCCVLIVSFFCGCSKTIFSYCITLPKSNPSRSRESSSKWSYSSSPMPWENEQVQNKWNWEVLISDKIGFNFSHLHLLYYHLLKKQIQKAKTISNSQQIIFIIQFMY